MAQDRTPQDQDKYVLRFPDGMRERIKDAAAENNRSMNAEIVARLEASFTAQQPDTEHIVTKVLDNTLEKLRKLSPEELEILMGRGKGGGFV